MACISAFSACIQQNTTLHEKLLGAIQQSQGVGAKRGSAQSWAAWVCVRILIVPAHPSTHLDNCALLHWLLLTPGKRQACLTLLQNICT